MKKSVALLLAGVMAPSLTACGGGPEHERASRPDREPGAGRMSTYDLMNTETVSVPY